MAYIVVSNISPSSREAKESNNKQESLHFRLTFTEKKTETRPNINNGLSSLYLLLIPLILVDLCWGNVFLDLACVESVDFSK